MVDRGLVERVLHPTDRPWEIIDSVRLESVRALRLTRFYIRSVKDPYGQGVSLFVGNLKKGLSQRLYEIILLERLGYQNKWDSIGKSLDGLCKKLRCSLKSQFLLIRGL